MSGGIGEAAAFKALQDIAVALNNIRQLISTQFPSATATLSTSATAGAASALPGAPEKYATVMVDGVAYKAALWKV